LDEVHGPLKPSQFYAHLRTEEKAIYVVGCVSSVQKWMTADWGLARLMI
jgi:hypothetical protein